MKKSILLSALIAAGLAMAPLAPAAYADDMKKDTMSKDSMKKDDGMKKDSHGQGHYDQGRWQGRHVQGHDVQGQHGEVSPAARPGPCIRGSGCDVYWLRQRSLAMTTGRFAMTAADDRRAMPSSAAIHPAWVRVTTGSMLWPSW